MAENKEERAEGRRLRNAELNRKAPGVVSVSGFGWHSEALVASKMSWLVSLGVDLGCGGSRWLMKKSGLLEVCAGPRAPTEKPDGGIYFRARSTARRGW